MSTEKIFDIRFTAPVGVMVLFIFLFSPQSFISLVKELSHINWVLNTVGILGFGFMISSFVNFITRKSIPYLNPPEELGIWRVLGKERKGNGEDAPNQIHKRWSVAMANFNVVAGLVLAPILSLVFVYFGKLNLPQSCRWIIFYIIFWTLSIVLFWWNGKDALTSIKYMNARLGEIHSST